MKSALSILLSAALVASVSAQAGECEDQPVYGGDCPVFSDDDCTEEGKRYRVACKITTEVTWCIVELR